VKLKALEDGLALFGNEFSKNDIAGGAHAASLEALHRSPALRE
jgi:hypothetical protein